MAEAAIVASALHCIAAIRSTAIHSSDVEGNHNPGLRCPRLVFFDMETGKSLKPPFALKLTNRTRHRGTYPGVER